ncbi:hypothetical protein GCM10027422_23080 [Hymenobacter arcticus]
MCANKFKAHEQRLKVVELDIDLPLTVEVGIERGVVALPVSGSAVTRDMNLDIVLDNTLTSNTLLALKNRPYRQRQVSSIT